VYKPFLIAPMQTAKDIGMEPWLSPQDAFPEMVNARLNKGVLSKRLGYTEEVDSGNGNPIIGFHKATRRDGQHSIIVADTKRLYEFDPYNKTLTELTSGDTFTGLTHNYMQFVNWQEKTYMTNFVDPPYVLNLHAGTIAAVDTGDISFDGVKKLLVYKNRIHYLGPIVNGEYYPDRDWFSAVLATTCTSATYVDADTDGSVMSVGKIRGEPFVFVKKANNEGVGVYRIVSSRDSTNPIYWEAQSDTVDSLMENVCVQFKDNLVVYTQEGFQFYDGYRGSTADMPKLRDFIDTMNVAKHQFCHAARIYEDEYLYMTYAQSGQQYANRMLEFNLTEKSFSESDIAMNCVWGWDGYYAPAAGDVITVNDGGATTMGFDLMPSDLLRLGPRTYAGGRDGKVYRLNSGGDDDGSDITVDIRTSRWNPFTKDGRKCRLGKIGFLVDTSATASYSVGFYKDQSSTAFKTQTLSCAGAGDKHWEYLSGQGEQGEFFRIKLYHTDSDNRPIIHAIMPYFESAGWLA